VGIASQTERQQKKNTNALGFQEGGTDKEEKGRVKNYSKTTVIYLPLKKLGEKKDNRVSQTKRSPQNQTG